MRSKRSSRHHNQHLNRFGWFFLRKQNRRQRKTPDERKHQKETIMPEQPGQQHTDTVLLASDQGARSVQQADSLDDRHKKEEQGQNRENDQQELLQSMSDAVDHGKEIVDVEEWRSEAKQAQVEQGLLAENASQEPCRNTSPNASTEHSKTSKVTSHANEINYSLVGMLQRLDFYLLWLVFFIGVISVAGVTDTHK
ncbi:hypothetical protein T265_15894, partial [Opisthorchis viverrini]